MPRAVRLAPSGIYGPAAIFRFALSRRGKVDVIYAGHAMEPFIRDEERLTVARRQRIERGDLLLCEVDQVGDIRRVLRQIAEGQYLTAIDTLPKCYELVSSETVLGVVEQRLGSGGLVGRAIAKVFPLWSQLAACFHWFAEAVRAVVPGEQAQASVKYKYVHQVKPWQKAQEVPIGPEFAKWMEAQVKREGSLLVVGCGAGREALHLAQCGWKITGIDIVPEMVDAARASAAQRGIDAEFICGDVVSLDLRGRKFDGVYVTPLVYSFIQGRDSRIAALRRMKEHLSEGGRILLNVEPIPSAREYLRSLLCWVRNRLRGHKVAELGDWYRDFLAADGRVGRSFVHRFRRGEVAAEIESAGLNLQSRITSGTYVVSARSESP